LGVTLTEDFSEETDQLLDIKAAIDRIVHYPVEHMHRESELGKSYSFRTAIEPTRSVIAIFERLPQATLHELPIAELNLIENQATNFYSLLKTIEDFDSTAPENTPQKRDEIVGKIAGHHQKIFSQLMPVISYLTVRGTDFSALETDARVAVQKAKDEARTAKESVEASAAQAEAALKTIQDTAAEMGVSQEAQRFKQAADTHDSKAKDWGRYTAGMVAIVAIYAVASIFLHKWNYLAPASTYEAVQLGLSKVLIFGVLSYLLFLCARNFAAHKHNAEINRHRQNALVTFKALVDAGRIDEKQDIVLTYAAECIYGSRDTGFTRSSSQNSGGAAAVVQMIPRTLGGNGAAE